MTLVDVSRQLNSLDPNDDSDYEKGRLAGLNIAVREFEADPDFTLRERLETLTQGAELEPLTPTERAFARNLRVLLGKPVTPTSSPPCEPHYHSESAAATCAVHVRRYEDCLIERLAMAEALAAWKHNDCVEQFDLRSAAETRARILQASERDLLERNSRELARAEAAMKEADIEGAERLKMYGLWRASEVAVTRLNGESEILHTEVHGLREKLERVRRVAEFHESVSMGGAATTRCSTVAGRIRGALADDPPTTARKTDTGGLSALDQAWDLTVEVENQFWPNNLTQPYESLAVALTSEVGEVCDQVKRIGGYGSSGRTFSEEELVEELTDVQSYLICFVMRLGLTREAFAQAMTRKMQKVIARMKARA